MRKTKVWLIIGIICSVLSLAVAVGCVLGLKSLGSHIEDYTEDWKKTEYVGFAKFYSDEGPAAFIPLDEMKDKLQYRSSKWSRYNTHVYYNNIVRRPDDVQYGRMDAEYAHFIYDLFEFALDNSTPYIYIDTRLVEKYDTLYDVLEILSMDSAVVNQNTRLTYYNKTFTLTREYMFTPMEKEVECVCIHIGDFTEENYQKTEKAVSKAEKILESLDIDEQSSELEIAREIYMYLGKNVKYKDYESYSNQTFLYDALCEGESNCDGFSNAFSLLCSLKGIECCEKLNTGYEGDTGHTWNTVKLDGVWYNVDATAAPYYYDGNLEGIPYRFCFSDSTQLDRHRYVDYIPECTEDIISYDLHIKNITDDSLPRKAADALQSTDRDYILMVVDNYDSEVMDSAAEEIVSRIYSGIRWVTVAGSYHTLVFIFPD